MFCSTNDIILNLTEKTKLLAQKCTHQIRVAAAPSQHRKNQPSLLSADLPPAESPVIKIKTCDGCNSDDERHHRKSSLKFFCSCSGGTLKSLKKRSKGDLATVKWYAKPTWRLWGEESEKDAIFTVYLKKVRYHRPTPSANTDSDDEISHLEWETVRVRFVKAATLVRLVEALATDDGELESTFINVFLSTYRTFSSTKEVLDLLIHRYVTLNEMLSNDSTLQNGIIDGGLSMPEQHKKTLVSAIHVWLDGFPEDWSDQHLRHLLYFTSKYLPGSDLHHKVLHRLERITRINQPPPPPYMINQQNNQNTTPPLTWSSQSYPDFAEQFGGLCLAPALRGPPSHLLQAYRFPYIPVKHFAEQLTRMDMELFKRLIPHQCLGAIWARRDKNVADTVVATVTQFNAVSYRVISSILVEPRLKPQERALIIATWVDIAQELRILKNFSSLKAIISGLQSHPVYRLSKSWTALCREKLEIFNELARIFSEDNNASIQRAVLMREGTAKFADTAGENDRHLQKVFQKQNHHTSHGTIPYLGTFLTDLTMIDTAIPDILGEGLINFDKRRKEFELLAQIKLLQGAANAYHLREDYLFDRWFASMLVLDEREAHTISCQIEPPTEPRRSNNSVGNGGAVGGHHQKGHRKTDSITSNSSSGAGSQFYCEINSNSIGSHHNSLDRDVTPPTSASMMSASSSVSNLSLDSSSSGHKSSNMSRHNLIDSKASANGTHISASAPIINAQLVQTNQLKNSPPDFYIIRVTYETDNVELDGIVLYKSIMLGNNERTPQVIRNAMMKLGLEDDPEKYTLAQVLPEKELVMPPSANVYYAVNTQYNLNFILRPKKNSS